ncbi:3-oxoacyl-ACP reductase [Leucobacter luti]|nr:3-oxoacyl-ACP reductase [Leucobacter luti]MBL3700486.1 3-oxoacyl-ACP reductase [Leucobacter luti]
MPASQPMLLRGVRWGAIATVTSMVVFAGIGFLVAESRGLLGGLIGAAIGGVLLLITVGSIAFANRFASSPMYLQVFFSIVLGAWIVKLIGFVVAALLLRDQPWLDPRMLFIALVATVLVSIVIDVIIVARARVPYVADTP